MPYVVHLSPGLEGDVLAALDHYSEIEPVLATRFADEVEHTLMLIGTYPRDPAWIQRTTDERQQ